MKLGLHHLEIYVSDLEKTKAFWSWFLKELGYKDFQSWNKGFSLKIETMYLVFVQVEPKFLDHTYHRCRVGLNHLAFHAKSRSQVDSLYKEIRNQEIKILYEDRYPYAGGNDYYALFFEDPDRIKVELVAPKLIKINL